MSFGYRVSNTIIRQVDFNKLAAGMFWLSKTKELLIESGDFCGAGLYPKKDVYLHKVCYDDNNIASWGDYDKLTLDQLLQKGFTTIDFDDTLAIIDKSAILNIKVVKIIKR